MVEAVTLPGLSVDPERERPASEELADALRNDRVEGFVGRSPYANCLLPLLRELGWHNYARELIEALPHFADDIDLVDLRNILISLGYESASMKARSIDLKPELFPCIFVNSDERVFILQERREGFIQYFDAQTGKYDRTDSPHWQGVAYVLTDRAPTHGVRAQGTGDDWFDNLLHRFRGLVTHLLGMTFIINLVALVVPLFVMLVYDKVIGVKSTDTLPALVTGIALLLVIDMLMRLLRARLLGSLAGRLDYLIGVETFRQLVLLPPQFTERSTVAAQLSRLKQFDSVRDFFTGPTASIALELPFTFLYIIVLALLAGWIAMIPVAMLAIYAFFGLVWLPALAKKVQRAGQARTDKQRALMQTLAGRRDIKAIGGESLWWERFREISGEVVMANHKTLTANAIMHSFAQGVMTLSGVLVVAFGTLAVIEGTLTVGGLIATMALVWRLLSPLQSAFLSFSKVQQTWRATKQINQLMRLTPERHSGQSGLMLSELSGPVKVDRVSYRYGPDQDPALLGVSFEVARGEMVAICGDTGSGKSTMLKLIAGMYRPQAGSLSIDDIDIRQLNAMDLRRSIAYVPQETRMFHGTIAQNLRLNNGLATDSELEAAAAAAGVLEDIRKLPKGFDTRLGDSTSQRMPPGFMRALSMARAFVSPARILLLDEPGASLDERSDNRLVERIKSLHGQQTIIMVSHRPSHIRLADKAVLMDQGSVKMVGRPDEVVEMMMELAK